VAEAAVAAGRRRREGRRGRGRRGGGSDKIERDDYAY
jgi:hypothetical protein